MIRDAYRRLPSRPDGAADEVVPPPPPLAPASLSPPSRAAAFRDSISAADAADTAALAAQQHAPSSRLAPPAAASQSQANLLTGIHSDGSRAKQSTNKVRQKQQDGRAVELALFAGRGRCALLRKAQARDR